MEKVWHAMEEAICLQRHSDNDRGRGMRFSTNYGFQEASVHLVKGMWVDKIENILDCCHPCY